MKIACQTRNRAWIWVETPLFSKLFNMINKTKQIHFRISPEEFESIKKNSSNFQGITHYIRSAIEEFSNANSKTKLEAARDLAKILKEFDYKLAHVGGNLNQAMHRCNELSSAGLLNASNFESNIHKDIIECYNLLLSFRKQVSDIVKKYI